MAIPLCYTSVALFRDFLPSFYGGKEKEEQTAEMPRGGVISNWLSVFGAPGVIVVDKDSMAIEEKFQDFCTSRNIALRTVIPGHHQSSGPLSVDADIFE